MSILDRVREAFDYGRQLDVADLYGQTAGNSAAEKEILDRADALEAIISTQGWKEVLAWLGAKCDDADAKLIGLESHDPHAIIGAQRYAKACRVIHDQLQAFILAEIQKAREIRTAKNPPSGPVVPPLYG